MIRPLALATALAALPLAASAETMLDRMERVGEMMGAKMNAAVEAEYPAVKGKMPSPEWDDAWREAGRCVLDAYVAEVGEAEVVAMLDKGEELMQRDISFEEMDAMGGQITPAGMSEARQVEISNKCGFTRLAMDRMMNSEAMAIIMEASQ